MIILKANKNDVDSILKIVDEQRAFLKNANIPQWQGAYPSYETFDEDIKKERLYVLKDEDEVVGFFALVYPDRNYDYIEDGKWLDSSEYIAIHRMAICNKHKGKGYASKAFDYVKEKYDHIRVDTHAVNLMMNNCLKKNNFVYCGVVYMEDKTKRNAYEWIRKGLSDIKN